jgi:hypothetical protein
METTRERLERRAELLLEQLRELDAEKHLHPADSFAAQRERLEAAAAETLRARDQQVPLEPAPSAPMAAAPGLLAGNPQLKGALWGGGLVLFFVTLGLVLGAEQKPREEAQGAPMAAPEAQAGAPTDELERLRVQLEAHPDDVPMLARAAHLFLKRQDVGKAEELTRMGLMLDPFHPETRVHAALVRSSKGDVGAEQELGRLAEDYPQAQEALLFLGMVRLQRGEKRGALEAFQRYLAEAPRSEQPPMLARTVQNLQAELGGAPR